MAFRISGKIASTEQAMPSAGDSGDCCVQKRQREDIEDNRVTLAEYR